MSNEEFLRRLETALRNRVPQEDVDDAMNYHREYFAEAGEDAAQELPTPETVAEQIIREREEYFRKRRFQWAKPVIIVAVCIVLVATAAMGWGIKHFFRSLWGRVNSPLPDIVVQTEEVEAVMIAPDAIETAQFTTFQDGDMVYVSGTVGAFDSVVVEGVSDAVTFTLGDGFFLDMWHSEKENVSYEVRNNTFYIIGEMTGIISTGFQSGNISITVPYGAWLSTMTVDSDIGNITVEDINAGNVYLNADLGNILVFNGTFRTLDCDSDLGNVTVSSVAADSLKCYCNAGNVEALEFTAKETELEADLGNVTAIAMGSKSDYALELEVDLGKIKVDGQKVSSPYSSYGEGNVLKARADVGNVTVDFNKQ